MITTPHDKPWVQAILAFPGWSKYICRGGSVASRCAIDYQCPLIPGFASRVLSSIVFELRRAWQLEVRRSSAQVPQSQYDYSVKAQNIHLLSMVWSMCNINYLITMLIATASDWVRLDRSVWRELVTEVRIEFSNLVLQVCNTNYKDTTPSWVTLPISGDKYKYGNRLYYYSLTPQPCWTGASRPQTDATWSKE